MSLNIIFDKLVKIGTEKSFHLTYCTNIHPGEDWSSVFRNLKQYIPILKEQLSPTLPFGIGLRLADVATRELLENENLDDFLSWLQKHDLYVFTINGFPYGGFHHQVVKDKVYSPDWSQSERLEYTLRLTKILAILLPEGIEGSISTLPLSYKPWFQEDEGQTESIFHDSSLNLAILTAELVKIRQDTGKVIHIDLEPEPDGLIENTTEVINFFDQWLLPRGESYLANQLSIPKNLARNHILDHICICYDTCHFAVEYENPSSVVERLQAAEIKIGKIQISAAIKVNVPKNSLEKERIVERLRSLAESTYLHQVIERKENGEIQNYQDLELALPHFKDTLAQEWRIHFHVPIFVQDYQLLHSTQDDIVQILELLQKQQFCNYLEIETYTWEVLPSSIKLELQESIKREYNWVLKLWEKQLS